MIQRLGPGGPPASSAVWQRARSADLKTISRIAEAIHPHLPESQASFAEKLQLFPKGCCVLALVSVYGTDVLWSRYGFGVVTGGRVLEKLASYGPTARYMTATVPP